MNRLVRHRMVLIAALFAVLCSFAVPVLAPPVFAAGDEPTVTVTESVAVTDLPVAGHGVHEPSDAGSLAVRHTLLTLLVLLLAAGTALGGLGLFWRYDRR